MYGCIPFAFGIRKSWDILAPNGAGNGTLIERFCYRTFQQAMFDYLKVMNIFYIYIYMCIHDVYYSY